MFWCLTRFFYEDDMISKILSNIIPSLMQVSSMVCFGPTMFFRKNIFVKLVHIYIENVSIWVSYYKVWSRIKKVMYLLIETIIIYFVTSKNILSKVFLFGECIYYYLTNMYCVYWSKHCNWTPSFTNTEKSAQNRDVAGIPEGHLVTYRNIE